MSYLTKIKTKIVLTSTEDVPEYSELYSQIKEKISNRKGATVIVSLCNIIIMSLI
jgi:hypothetical protein